MKFVKSLNRPSLYIIKWEGAWLDWDLIWSHFSQVSNCHYIDIFYWTIKTSTKCTLNKSNGYFLITLSYIPLYSLRYSHDASSLCRTSSLRWISFLEDTQSGCFLQLSRKNFTDCEQLRNEISRIQAQYMLRQYALSACFQFCWTRLN